MIISMVDMEKDKTKLVRIEKKEGFKFSPDDFIVEVDEYEEGEDYVAIKFKEEKTIDFVLDDMQNKGYNVKAYDKAVERTTSLEQDK